MFAAVRGHFRHWDEVASATLTSRRARRLAALFVFEFVVVVLGVLVAQRLQDYATDRRARADARAALDRARAETGNARGMAGYWLQVAPCLEDRLDQLSRAAASGGTVPAHYLERPRMPYTPVNRWSEATTLAARRTFGDELVTDFSDIADMSQHMLGATRELSAEWETLRLIDPAIGGVSPADRANARLAAARIKSQLAALTSTAGYLLATADRRGIRHSSRTIPLPTGCGGGRP